MTFKVYIILYGHIWSVTTWNHDAFSVILHDKNQLLWCRCCAQLTFSPPDQKPLSDDISPCFLGFWMEESDQLLRPNNHLGVMVGNWTTGHMEKSAHICDHQFKWLVVLIGVQCGLAPVCLLCSLSGLRIRTPWCCALAIWLKVVWTERKTKSLLWRLLSEEKSLLLRIIRRDGGVDMASAHGVLCVQVVFSPSHTTNVVRSGPFWARFWDAERSNQQRAWTSVLAEFDESEHEFIYCVFLRLCPFLVDVAPACSQSHQVRGAFEHRACA